MSRSSISLPIHIEPSISDVMQGVFEIEGLLQLDVSESTLTLEYRTNSSFLGNAQVKTVALSQDDVSRVETRRSFFGGKLILHPARLSAFNDVPGHEAGRVVLKVRHAHLDTMEHLGRHLEASTMLAAPLAPSSVPDASLPPLPFEIRTVHAGFSHATGMLSFDDEFVVLDVQVVAFGLFKHEPFQIRIERSVIREARLVRRFRRDRLYLTPKKFEVLAAMPGRHREELRLDVRSEHRQLSERIVTVLRHPPQ